MKRWGILITAFYIFVVAVLIVPGFVMLGVDWSGEETLEIYRESLLGAYREWWMTWVWVGVLVGGQAVLLLVSVDTSWRRLKPRQHILASVGTAVLLLGLLTFAAVWSLAAAAFGDTTVVIFNPDEYGMFRMLGCWIGLWLLWGMVFYLYRNRAPQLMDRLLGWLLKGSVLELLIAVPCHVIVRRREDCSAPIATGFGIATGIAIMLLSFGPSVLFLYKKRMKQYEK